MGKNKKDSLGDRMKSFYENRTRTYLPRRTYTIIRIDGKAFHTYTRGMERPFDKDLIEDMDNTSKYLCKNISGAKMAFVQSDEISIIVTDFDNTGTSAWFDGNIQKMASVSASMATSIFNYLRILRKFDNSSLDMSPPTLFVQDYLNIKLAEFDARVFTVSSKTEVMNYLIWRQQDTVRNSISSVAQSLYSSKELHGVNTGMMQEMCFQKGINWNNYPLAWKNGRMIVKEEDPIKGRTHWVSRGAHTFTVEDSFLNEIIPTLC